MGERAGSVEVVIKGGRPWGFTLQGGIENRSALVVSQIEPSGKAERQGVLKVGDHVIKINDVQCVSLADALQLIECAFRTLTILVWRSGNSTASSKGDATLKNPCVPDPKTPMPKSATIRQSARVRSSSRKSPSSTEGRKCSSTQASSRRPGPKSTYHQLDPSLLRNEISAWASQNTSVDTSDASGEHGMNLFTPRLTLEGSVSLPEPLTSGRRRRLSNVSTASSSIASHKDLVFSGSEYPTQSRSQRSPRKLTKDSGYETSVPGEPDYVNSDWITAEGIKPLTSNSVSDGHTEYTRTSFQTKESQFYHPKRPSRYSHCVQNPNGKNGTCKYPNNAGGISRSVSCYSSSESLSLPPVNIENRHLERTSSQHSSTESLASWSNSRAPSVLHSTKSSSSFALNLDFCHISVQSHSTSRHYSNYPPYSEQTFCGTNVSPARSVPNLGLESDMVTRRFNKKPSVYEALANKSGLDFAPVIHRQPYWSRRNVFENDPTAEHVSRVQEKKRYVDDHQEAGPRSLPIFGDENVKSETDRYFNSKNHDPKRECFQKRVEPMDPFHEQNNNAPTILRERTISPPLIPTRDSSLRYRASSAHEKYPSWPVSLPEAVEVSQPVSTSNHRSNSWTESTIYPKEKNTSYSRPKRMFQISTQQLHPVQEKTSESTSRNDPKGNSDTYVPNYRPPETNVQKYKNPDAEFMDESISKYFTLDSAYADSKWKTYANNRYNAHSPPERDTTVCSTSVNESKSYDDEEYAKKYGDMLRYYSQSPALYGNWSRESPHTSVGDSNTPLLDRLRQERQTLPSAWQPVIDGDSPSEAGTCTESIDSNSSSQETLKWHGSYSDLCSLNAPTSDSSVFGDSEHSSVVGADRSTSQYVPPCIANSSNSFKPDALKYKEIMTHNSRTEAEEKLRNMRSIPNSTPSHKLPTFEQTNIRSAELEVTQCNALSPTSPSKNSGIYFYENRIKMLREENRNPTGSQIFQTSFPGFSKSSGEETHEPPPAPATKPCKRFRDSSMAKGHDISNQSVTCREKPHNQTAKSNAGAVMEKNESYCGFYTAKGWPVRRTEYCGEQNRRHRVSDPELKALQKQAVLSFYHRQTALESGDWSDTKCDRSGIGPNQVESLDSVTPTVGSRSVSSGPNSFPKKPLPEIPPKPASLMKDFAHSTTVHNKEPSLPEVSSDSNISACSSLRSSRISLVSDFSEASCSNTGQQDCGLNSLYENVCSQLVNQNARIRESKESKATNSSNSLWLHGGGRKAHFKKVYNANETAIVKVISSEGVTIVETIEASDPDKDVVKPQLPLQKTSKPLSSSPPACTISPSVLTSTTSVPASTMTSNLVIVQDAEEDEELRQIEESFQNHMKLAMLRSSSSSPELPLPPPPSSTDTEVHHTDDPLPPPPMEVNLGDYVQIQDQNTEIECPTAASRITYPQMEIFHPPNPTAEPQVIDHQPRAFLPHGLASPAATEATYENVPNSKCHFANENAAEKELSSRASATQDLPLTCRSDLSPGLPPPLLEDTPEKGGKSCQRPVREIQVEKEEDLEEALYVNLDLLRLQVQNGDAYDLIPNGSEMCSPVSVTNSATQTSDNTPSLPRKPNKVGKSHVELECERLSRDFVNHFGDTALRNLLLPAPNHKTMSDYMEGLLELDLEKGTKLNYRCSQVNRNLHDRVSQPPNDNNCRSNVGLPLTSAYFTTSEPKAKLLTRYCHNLEKKDWTNGIELYGRKEELITSIGKKLEILRSVQISLQEEVDQNEQLGKEVTTKVEKLAKPNELEKYKLHIEELEKIINLLLSLSGRLARAQNALLILPKEAKAEERNMLESKRDKLSEQHDEARRLKENIDRRSQQVSMFLHHYLSKDEYADYDHFIKMKSKLLMDAREIDEKIKLGEEQMAALRSSMDSHIWNGTAFSLLSNGQQIILNRT